MIEDEKELHELDDGYIEGQPPVEEDIEEVDPFTLFMFGQSPNRRYRENHSTEETVLEYNPVERGDWFLGRRISQERSKEEQIGTPVGTNEMEQSSSLNGLLQNINYLELMEHVDTLMTSAGQLKPLFTKIKPLFEQFINKK